MADFKTEIDTAASPYQVKFFGPIDENSSFPDMSAVATDLIVFDMKGITHINSIGIKCWIQWLDSFAGKMKIEFVNVPKSIIFQMNMVKNFLPNGSVVKSFFLPLYCEDEDRDTSVLIQVGKDVLVKDDQVKIVTPLADLVAADLKSLEWEIDVIEKKYFRFLIGG